METYKNDFLKIRKTAFSKGSGRGRKRAGNSPALSNRDYVLHGYATDRTTVIRHLDGKTAKGNILKTLYFVCELVNIPSDRVPAREVMKKYAEYIYKNFDFLHTEEIPYAFELSLVGDLEIMNPNHKGYFDLGWITRVLRAYFNFRTERANRVRLVEEREEAIRANISERIRTDRRTRALLVAYYEQFRTYGTVTGPAEDGSDPGGNADFNTIYCFLEYAGFISISLELKKEMYAEAEALVWPEVIREEGAGKEGGRPLNDYEKRILRYKAVRSARVQAIMRVFSAWKKADILPENVNLSLKTNFCVLNLESFVEMNQLIA